MRGEKTVIISRTQTFVKSNRGRLGATCNMLGYKTMIMLLHVYKLNSDRGDGV